VGWAARVGNVYDVGEQCIGQNYNVAMGSRVLSCGVMMDRIITWRRAGVITWESNVGEQWVTTTEL
jgi:hypothetical protein